MSARAGDEVIEGIEPLDPAWWMLGVQWHPEEPAGAQQAPDRRLFTAFAEAVASEA